MIIGNFKAGFGNQMWQYALTRAAAEHNHYGWGFNPIPYYSIYNGVPQFDFMDIDYGIKHNYELNERPPFIKHVWREKWLKLHSVEGDEFDYFPYQPEIFNIFDDTQLYITCGIDARYLQPIKEEVRQWFKIKEENTAKYEQQLKALDIELDNNLTVLHIRGTDFRGDSRIILPKKYWEDAINIMKDRKPKMRFLCVTDDIKFTEELFESKIPVFENSLAFDYYIINHAKNLILSNSSFNVFATWLNENKPYVVAPRYWWRYNLSNGHWCPSDMYTFGWNYLGRDGKLYDN